MLKINFVTMKEEIEDILMNSYDNFGFFDEAKATKELLNLFGVSNSYCRACIEDTETDIVSVCKTCGSIKK